MVIAKLKTANYNLFKPKSTTKHKPINTSRFSEPGVKEQYKTLVKEQLHTIEIEQFEENQQKWDKIVNTLVECGEQTLGFKTSTKNNITSDIEIEKLSNEKKQLRIQITSCRDKDKLTKLKHERNRLLKQIHKQIKENEEREIDEKISDINNMPDEAKMFKSVKMLNRKKFENPYIYDSEGKIIANPNEIYKTVKNHFRQHFTDTNTNEVESFIGLPKNLNKPITDEEVKKVIDKLNNNRAAGPDRISAELIKYGPQRMHRKPSTNSGILVALQKPGKPKGPVKNLRPINLLLIIRKILSNITIQRIELDHDKYLSSAQSAYRSNRSTADIVWAHRWIAAKIQRENLKAYITGLDMTSAFDTIRRDDLINILETIIGEDEVRFARLLLSNTTLDVKMNGAKTENFQSNIGSPQGDGISGILFNIYLEDTLRRTRKEIDYYLPPSDHTYSRPVPETSNLPEEIVYVDDTDFIANNLQRKEAIVKAVEKVFPSRNLKVNAGKTEHTTLERGDRNTESWRYVKKVGSLLGDTEDIMRRKQLAIASMNSMNKIWIRRTKIEIKYKLYNALVKPVLTYNCATWGLTKQEEQKLDAFHRQQLRHIIGKKYPHIISNYKSYKRCKLSTVSFYPK